MTRFVYCFSFNLPRVNAQLERLMGSNVVHLTDRKYMVELRRRITEDFENMLLKRINQRKVWICLNIDFICFEEQHTNFQLNRFLGAQFSSFQYFSYFFMANGIKQQHMNTRTTQRGMSFDKFTRPKNIVDVKH